MNLKGLSFESIQVGQELPPLRKEINRAHMMMYGAATWDFIRLHYDDSYVRERGLPAPIVDGQMLGAYLSQLVIDWAGPGAFLKALSFRNRGMVFPGDTLTCQGRVTAKNISGGEGVVECQLWIENQRGERVVEPASAMVALPPLGGGS